MIKHLLTICSFLLLLSSCKKDDDEDNDPKAITKENLSANYKVISASGKNNLLGTIDILNNDDYFPACQRDDILTLKSDFSYVTTDAGVKCTPSTAEEGVWELPNTSTIIIDGEAFTILSFDGRDLQVGYSESAPPFGQVDITAVLRKQ